MGLTKMQLTGAPQALPRFVAEMAGNGISISIGDEVLHIVRHETGKFEDRHDEVPEDVGDNIPG